MHPGKPQPAAATGSADLGPTAAAHRDGLRVALVSEYYYPDIGGMPEHVHHLAIELCRRGHAVTLITTAFAEPPAPPAPPNRRPPPALPYDVVRLGRASGALITNGSVSRAAVGLGLGAEMARLFRQRCFDVIHVHAPIFPTLSLLAIRSAPASALLVGTLHTHLEDSALLRLLRRPLQRYFDALDGIIAVSESALSCMRRLGFDCDGEIIPNGVDLDYWQGGHGLSAWQDGALHLVAQARLEPRNHIGTIIEAMHRLQQAPGAAPRLRLLLLGDGPERAQLERASVGLPVHFAGAVHAERADFVATSDIYCFTAALASHPMALLEGMAAGRPVLAHDIDGVGQLVRNGIEGLVLPLRDPAAYAEALRRLAADPALRQRMGAAARARVAPFAWPRIATQIEAFYRDCDRRRRRRPAGAAPP
jgi:phosphatidylinositol alpha-mannosyltransferase